MSRYFMRDTSLAGLETAMMFPPFFKQRQSGVAILNRFRYTKESTDCRGCMEWENIKECGAPYCPWLVERLEACNVSYSELLKECFRGMDHKSLQVRLQHLAAGFHGRWFQDACHRHRFELVDNSLRILSGRTPNHHIAALFLLTADEKLWQLCKNIVTGDTIGFESIKLCGISTDGYAFYQMARTLSTGQAKITVSELADGKLICNSMLAVMVDAILIARFGSGVLEVMQ
ncbi:MAG: hypothetical protein ACOX0K_01420 [Oscillospiraceae bacterium]